VYHDDREADRARIETLERELEAAKDKISSLEGRRENALVLATRGALAKPGTRAASQARWFGAPLELSLSRTFDGAFPVERLEELLGRIRGIVPEPGAAELLRSSLTWRSTPSNRPIGTLVVHVAIKDGATSLVVTERLVGLAGALYGGVGGGVGGGGLMLPVMASVAVPVLTPLFVLGWLGGVFAGTRALFKRAVRRRAERVQELFDAVAADIAAALAPEAK
jgi:hypothetical protein